MELLGIISLPLWLLLSIVALVVLHRFMTKNYGLWEKQGLTEVRPVLVLEVLNFLRKLSTDVERENYMKYGRLYGSFLGDLPCLWVSEPQLIKAVLVKDFHIFRSKMDLKVGCPMWDLMLAMQQGEDWKRVRSIVTPTFTSGRLKKMSPLMQDIIQTYLRDVMKGVEHDISFDVVKWYKQPLHAVMARIAFGTKIENMQDDDHPFVVNSNKMFTPAIAYRCIFKVLFPKLAKFFKVDIFPTDALNYLKTVAKSIMQQRKETKQRGSDFLQLILDAQEGTLDTTAEDPSKESHFHVGVSDTVEFKSTSNKKFVSEDEALAQCVMFLAGAADMTAFSLAAISYELALNPDCQDKLIEEIDAFWERTEGIPDLTEINKLPYFESVISESLRLHTPVSRLERIAEANYVLSDKGIKLPKGTLVEIPIAAIHSDPEWFPQPDKFDPERFSVENRKTMNPYTFLPFGAGPRHCVATRFALLQIKLFLVNLLRHISFLRSPETKVPLEMRRALQGELPKSVILTMKKRQTIN